MFQKLSKKLRKKQGFTLIELIVVLAILGIILAIAVPNYLGVQAKAAGDADTRTEELVEKAVKLWWTMEPATTGTSFVVTSTLNTTTGVMGDLTLTGTPAGVTQAEVDKIVTTYLEEVPKSQAGDTLLTITVSSDGGEGIKVEAAFSTPS